MSAQTKAANKAKFQTGDVPTQTDFGDLIDSYQDADADLTAIAALTPTDNDFLQRKAGAWTNRTVAQVKTDLALDRSDLNNQYSELGAIFTENWANLSNWTNVGTPSASVSANKLSLGGTASWSTNYIRCTGYGNSNIDQGYFEWTETVGTTGGSNGGIAFALQSQAVYASNIQVHLDLATGGNQGKISWYADNAGTAIQTSTKALTGIAAGYIIQHRLTLYAEKYVLTVNMFNGSTWVDGFEDTYYFSTYPLSGSAINVTMPNAFHFAFLNRGGDSTIGSFVVTCTQKKNAEYLIIGDSQTKRYRPSSQGLSYIDHLQRKYHANIEINAGAGNSLIDINTTEVGLYAPKKLVIFCSTNKIAQTDAATALTELATFLTAISSVTNANAPSGYSIANGNVILCTTLPRGAAKYPSFNASLITTYGIANIIDLFASVTDGTNVFPIKYSGDGIHFNDQSSPIAADKIASLLGLKKREFNVSTIVPVVTDHATGYVSIGRNATKPNVPLQITDGSSQLSSSAFLSSDFIAIGAVDTNPSLTISAAGASVGNRAIFNGVALGGTLAAPTVTATGRFSFSLMGRQFDGTSANPTASIDMVADGAQSTGNSPQSIVFQTGATTSRSERVRISPQGHVGIGTSTPTTYTLDVQEASNTIARFYNSSAAGIGSGALISCNSPRPTASGHRLGGVGFGSINGTSATSVASIEGFASESHTIGTAQGGYISFFTTPNGTATRLGKMRLSQAGNLAIGSDTDATATLQIAAGTTTNAPLRITAGVAPTSPNAFDIWSETTNNRLMFRQNAINVEVIGASAVNSVMPTLPDRTITVVINGTTYYIAAKTTND